MLLPLSMLLLAPMPLRMFLLLLILLLLIRTVVSFSSLAHAKKVFLYLEVDFTARGSEDFPAWKNKKKLWLARKCFCMLYREWAFSSFVMYNAFF
jgi:hypothetical protein